MSKRDSKLVPDLFGLEMSSAPESSAPKADDSSIVSDELL